MESEYADHTFVEGDNLDALKLLLPKYEGQVRLIFIDPPYNTGSDRFLYLDDFSDAANRHVAWCSMMLPRLVLARRFLREDGVLFVSIGDDEVHHLAMLLNEVFGDACFVANMIWRRRRTQANLSKLIAPVHDYVLCYAKDKTKLHFHKIGYSEAFIRKTFTNPDNDPRGPYQTRPLAQPDSANNRSYALTMPNGRTITARWSCSEATFDTYLKDNRLFIPKRGNGMPRLKIFLKDQEGSLPNTWLDDVGSNEDGSREIERLFGSTAFFISPKPTALLQRLIAMACDQEDLILDFFAGSGTTAHAVALMNETDGGHRKSISVQWAEPTDPKSLPHQQGLLSIAGICKERIRRVLAGMNTSRAAGGRELITFNIYSLKEARL